MGRLIYVYSNFHSIIYTDVYFHLMWADLAGTSIACDVDRWRRKEIDIYKVIFVCWIVLVLLHVQTKQYLCIHDYLHCLEASPGLRQFIKMLWSLNLELGRPLRVAVLAVYVQLWTHILTSIRVGSNCSSWLPKLQVLFFLLLGRSCWMRFIPMLDLVADF